MAIIGVATISCADGKSARGAVESDRAQLLPAGGKPVDGVVEELSGKEVQLAELRGKAALLDFFATWCEPCLEGLPRTDALVKANAARGLSGWAISIDEKSEPVAPFVKKLGLTIPARWDPGAKTADRLGVEMLPSVVLLDSRGAVRYRAAPDDRAFDRHLEEALEALLQEDKP